MSIATITPAALRDPRWYQVGFQDCATGHPRWDGIYVLPAEDGDGYIDAINVFYAGFPTGGWSVGLWPHSSVVTFGADGVSAYRYQITNIDNEKDCEHYTIKWRDD